MCNPVLLVLNAIETLIQYWICSLWGPYQGIWYQGDRITLYYTIHQKTFRFILVHVRILIFTFYSWFSINLRYLLIRYAWQLSTKSPQITMVLSGPKSSFVPDIGSIDFSGEAPSHSRHTALQARKAGSSQDWNKGITVTAPAELANLETWRKMSENGPVFLKIHPEVDQKMTSFECALNCLLCDYSRYTIAILLPWHAWVYHGLTYAINSWVLADTIGFDARSGFINKTLKLFKKKKVMWYVVLW